MDSSSLWVLGYTIFSATLLNALLGFILWNAPQLEDSSDRVALRYFMGFFAAIALTHLLFGLRYNTAQWANVLLILSNTIYVLAYYYLYLGLCSRSKSQSILSRPVVALSAFSLFVMAFVYFTFSPTGAPAYRGALLVISVGGLLGFCLRVVPGKRVQSHQGNQLTRWSLWASLALLLVLGFFIAWLDAGDIKLLFVGSITSMATAVLLFGGMYGSFLHDAVSRHYQLSITDSLTGLHNRRYLIEESKMLLSSARRHNSPVSVVICDVDNFKRINDQHGHDAGDKALKAFAHVLQGCVRNEDILARWGGEEFVVLMANTEVEQARALVERVRKETGQIVVAVDGALLKFTASFGVTLMAAGVDVETGVKQADKALYRAKNAGRNRVEIQRS
jgi:diguanylate cyclase (GGDEF)-like protein